MTLRKPFTSSKSLNPMVRFWVEHRWLHYLALACVMTAAAQSLHVSRFLLADFLDNFVLDFSFGRRGSANPKEVAEKLPHTRNIIIVEMTHEVPRPILKKLLEVLREARVVVFDLMFVDHEGELKGDEKEWYSQQLLEWDREDADLAHAFQGAAPVIIGTWPEQVRTADLNRPGRYHERRIWQRPPSLLWNSARYRAHLWIVPDAQDGFVRRVPAFQQDAGGAPCLGLAAAAAAKGISAEALGKMPRGKDYFNLGSRRVPLDNDGCFLIDYLGDRQCFEYETQRVVYEVALGYPPSEFRDRIVFIGATDFKAKDIFTTPFGDMAGVQIHANVAATLLSPKGPPGIVSLRTTTLLSLMCSLLIIVPLLRLPLWSSLLAAVGEILLVVLGAAWVFCRFHFVIPVSAPAIAIVLTYNGIGLYEYARVRFTLGKFVGSEMVPRLMNVLAAPRLGGQLGEASAFFCDLRGYTELSEQLPPEQTAQILNEYTNAVVEVVRKHHGRAIDYLGDGVFVLFERPLIGEDYALKAVNAALEVREVVAESRDRWLAGRAGSLDIGIAIHSGRVLIGVVGSEHHMKLGAVGDVINVAARVQGLSRECGYDILLTQSTHDLVSPEVQAAYCGRFAVKGRGEPVDVYGIGSTTRSSLE
ncbi:MAG: adenylate/guanylate cyclase domain-containing protein [Armatimonadetes bacterium]|nr:adenylate/guanylate cyclase domain-containing protein [Armatimonadota bacterium]